MEEAVTEWEYLNIDLNQHRPRKDELEVLNAAGADGWELVGIASNNVAHMKRECEPLAPTPSPGHAKSVPRDAHRDDNVVTEDQPASGVKPKYRDPQTGETWSGRGRMATWLKRRQDAGEDIEKYLV
jgi:DNA-binding protein H-NS